MSPFLPALSLLPPLYLFCLLLVNVVIHYATLEEASSLPWALLSMIVPRPPSSTPLPAARRLLVVNVAVNTLIHALLWAALTGACSQVTTSYMPCRHVPSQSFDNCLCSAPSPSPFQGSQWLGQYRQDNNFDGDDKRT